MNTASATGRFAAMRASLALFLCLFCLEASAARNVLYRDPLKLWTDTVSRSPGKARTHYNLGNALRDSGDMPAAVSEWKTAVTIDPRYSMAYNQLGNVSFLAGALGEAEHYYLLSVASEPGNAEAQYNLALVSESLGKRAQAVEHYRRFLAGSHGQPDEVLQQAASRLRALTNP